MYFLPTRIREVFKERFQFPEKPLFASVATSTPSIRTMRLFDFDEKGRPLFFTHTGSKKWKEISKSPKISACIISEDKLLQLIFSGAALLENLNNPSDQHALLWKRVREDVKKIYDPNYSVGGNYKEPDNLKILKDPPSTFGVLRIIPSFWEILELKEEYLDSLRTVFTKEGDVWKSQRMNLS